MNKDVKELNEERACPIVKHTPKSFGVAFVLGIVIGLAIIVPGVSGSTVAIMFGMYASMLYAIGNIFNDFCSYVSVRSSDLSVFFWSYNRYSAGICFPLSVCLRD